MLVKHIPFLDRPFTNQSAISRWVIQQLPTALLVDGRSLLRPMTAAQLADTPGVTDVCIDLVSAANDSNKNFKDVTEMIGAAIPGGEQSGRRPAGLGKGGGRGGDSAGAEKGGKGAGAGGKGAGGKGAGGKGTPKPKATKCSVLPPRGPTKRTTTTAGAIRSAARRFNACLRETITVCPYHKLVFFPTFTIF